jgi:hypothetical protein
VIKFVLSADEDIELRSPGNRLFSALVLDQVHDAMALKSF